MMQTKKKNDRMIYQSINLESQFNQPRPYDPALPPVGGINQAIRLEEFGRRQEAIRRRLFGGN